MKKYKIKGNKDKSILEILQEEGVKISADCGGRGTCGKCKIIIDNEEVLACKTFTEKDIEIEIPEGSDLDTLRVEMLPEEKGRVSQQASEKHMPARKQNEYSMAVDIGTTTVAAALTDGSFAILAAEGLANSQKIFGSDVISRVETASVGKLHVMKKCIREDVETLKNRLADKCGIAAEDIRRIVISANTVMEHIFMGYSCKGFEKAPYSAVTLEEIHEGEFELLPCISPFVGADILSGIAVTEMDRQEEITALIDLGTNGEMALGNSEGILVSSTAAGPVFEGGNISCGMSAMDSAINKVEIYGQRTFAKTIGDKKPLGICAAGLIEAVYSMRKNGIINGNGILDDEWLEDGFYLTDEIVLTQDDINSFLMAKSAIASGLEILCSKRNIQITGIKKIYIAGGLGAHINIDAACGLGLIPKELSDCCEQIGNSSLKGALMRCRGDLSKERADKIKSLCTEIVLADEAEFGINYIKNMSFDKI